MARVNHDPDGLDCYSDHAHDIEVHGECAFCGSTDPDVVGHVLAGVERLTGLDPVDAAAIVVRDGSAKIVDGVLVDHYSASAITTVYSALSDDRATAKLRAMSLATAATVCFRVLNRAR